jgi:cyclopropane fatty-acyl-phospholipid synthase-like methyltransferase
VAYSKEELIESLTLDQFPRSAGYDLEWILGNQMGPNVLWLTESLTQVIELKPGMRVLDMGCGRAISSIFLAKEFEAQVWATDLWIEANENWQRVCGAGMQQQVFPIHAEAHNLPFAEGFFDAILSMDAYHYFGTDDLYLGYISRYLKPGGQIGIVVPGLHHEFEAGVPEHLEPYWDWEFSSFHSPEWWRRHWDKTGKVNVELADMIPDGWEHWMRWVEVVFSRDGREYAEQEAEMLRIDAGRNLGFTRLVGRLNDRLMAGSESIS